MALRLQDLGTSCSQCYWSTISSRPSQGSLSRKEGNIYNDVRIHTQLHIQPCIYWYLLKPTGQESDWFKKKTKHHGSTLISLNLIQHSRVHSILSSHICNSLFWPWDTWSPALQVDSSQSEPPGKPKNTGVIAYPFPGDLPDPGIELASPAWLGDSSPAELPGNMPLHRTSLQMRVQYWELFLLLAWGHRVQVMI